MLKKFLFILLGGILSSNMFAQLSSDKRYTIVNRNDINLYVQDNGANSIQMGAKNSASYWQFEPTGNENCYYVKNSKTGKYAQSCKGNEVEVQMGDTPVEYYVAAVLNEGDGMYGLASTDQNTYNFTSGTIGWNWKNNNTVQGYAAVDGSNHRSFWKISETINLNTPYEGVDPTVGTEFYLYNVKTGKWLGDNHVNTDGTWTSHGELGPRGRDLELITGNAEGRFQINPKLGNNHSINGSNLYMDTGDGVTNWIFTPAIVNGSTIFYQLTTPGGKALGANADGWATSEPSDISEDGNIWQLVSREQRLAALQEGDDCSWLVLGGTFPVADSHIYESAYKTWNGDFGSNAVGGDGFYHCNRVWELWNITDRDVYQDINVRNGKYKFKAQAIYASTGGSDMNVDRYNEYLADPTGNTKGVVYANDVTTPMVNVYSLVTSERVSDRNTKEITSDVWAYNGTNEFSTNIFEGKGWTEEVEVEVKDGKLRVGARVENGSNAWILIDNFTLTYDGEIVVEDLTPYIEALENMIAQAESYNGETTEVLAAALQQALINAKNVSREDADAMTNATTALETALNNAMAVDVTVLKATINLAEHEGISIPESVQNFLITGVNDVDSPLRLVRNLRKLNAIEKVDISLIECSEPVNEETDYYLYNVGAQVFFSTTADWGTHIAIDNPGMLIHFRPDGEWNGSPGRPVFHLSGNGWDGMNWQEEYWDKNGENKLAFVPVEGKEKVYNLCEWDNYNWHFVYDPAEDVCDGNTHYWNSIQKRNSDVANYKDNPYAQWMLVSPEAYKAAMAKTSGERPLDVTFLIDNPNFTKAKVNGEDNWDRGWTGVGDMMGRGRDPWCVIEWYEKNANMSQTITGLAPGKYIVSCYGFYRDGNSDHEAGKVGNDEDLIQNAFLTVNGIEVALPNVTSEAGKMPGIGETRNGVNGEFACWPWQANEYFQTGLYKVSTPVVEVSSDSLLTIGIQSTYNNEPGSWVVVGNFRLTCLGLTVPVTISEKATDGTNNYGTLYYSDRNLVAPEGIGAYTATVADGEVTLTKIEGAIPAGTGVVLKTDSKLEQATTFNFAVSSTAGTAAADNMLNGTDVQTEISGEGFKYYMLSLNGQGEENSVGFYWGKNSEGGTKLVNGAHKAYLAVPNANDVFESLTPFVDSESLTSEVIPNVLIKSIAASGVNSVITLHATMFDDTSNACLIVHKPE